MKLGRNVQSEIYVKKRKRIEGKDKAKRRVHEYMSRMVAINGKVRFSYTSWK